MTLDQRELAAQFAKACAYMVANFTDDGKEELSADFVEIWNKAIKHVTPLEFCKMVCDELENEKK